MNDEFFETCMSDLQHGTLSSVLPLAMTTQHQALGITSSHMNIPSSFSGVTSLSCLYEGGPEFGFPGNTIDISSRALPNSKAPDEASHTSYGSLASEKDSAPMEFGMNSSVPPAKVRKVFKHRRIIAMPADPVQGITGGIDLNNTTNRGSKKRGRNGPLLLQTKEEASSMRKKIACAACFVNNVKVSNYICSKKLADDISQCSSEDVCARCLKRAKSPFLGVLCHRGHMQKHMEVLSPRKQPLYASLGGEDVLTKPRNPPRTLGTSGYRKDDQPSGVHQQ